MKVTPLHDRLLVKREKEEARTKSGLIIPDTAREKPAKGKVSVCGPGRLDDKGKRHPLDVKKGDRVLFSQYAGTEIKIEGEEYLFMKESDILGIIE
ncbi:MAG: co-chaperone GroES [Desulfosudaceae bacterium]